MDYSKALETLVKIASNNQKMIDKLAQPKKIDRRWKPSPLINTPLKTPFNPVIPEPPEGQIFTGDKLKTPLSGEITPEVEIGEDEQSEAINRLLAKNEEEQRVIETEKIRQARLMQQKELADKPYSTITIPETGKVVSTAEQFIKDMARPDKQTMNPPYEKEPLFADMRSQKMVAIKRFMGVYNPGQSFGEQEQKAIMRAQQELRGAPKGLTRSEEREKYKSMTGTVGGLPNRGERELGELRGKAQPIIEAMEIAKTRMLDVPNSLASQALTNAQRMLELETDEKEKRKILEEVTKLETESKHAKRQYVQLAATLEPIQAEIDSIEKSMQASTEVEFIDANGLVERRKVPLNEIRMLHPKIVDRKGKKTFVVEVEDMDNLPPDLKRIIGARTDIDIIKIAKLVKIAKNQQKIISKLAEQVMQMPPATIKSTTPGYENKVSALVNQASRDRITQWLANPANITKKDPQKIAFLKAKVAEPNAEIFRIYAANEFTKPQVKLIPMVELPVELFTSLSESFQRELSSLSTRNEMIDPIEFVDRHGNKIQVGTF
jgi:hypothetical protein